VLGALHEFTGAESYADDVSLLTLDRAPVAPEARLGSIESANL